MLTLEQLQLIKRIELFSSSPFTSSLIDDKRTEHPFYIVSDDEFSLYLTIPPSKMRHIAHISVMTLYPEDFSQLNIAATMAARSSSISSTVDLDSSNSLEEISRLACLSTNSPSGELVTPPLRHGIPG